MSLRKHNEYLDIGESGDDEENDAGGDGYDSDAEESSRGLTAGRSSKRRRLEWALDEDALDRIEGEASDANEKDVSPAYHKSSDTTEHRSEEVYQAERVVDDKAMRLRTPASTSKQIAATQKAAQRSGVVYISRVPPFMKPQTLRHFLAPYASKGLGRIFLTPEDHEEHSRRVRSGGNKKKSYTDGWVEFLSKREAKIAVEMLNGNIIGGKKGNFYHDDLWSMKYLKGFKWSHLTEQIANENAERAARMREEVRKTRKENRAFVEDVERGKMLEGMEAKRKAKGDTAALARSAPARRSGKHTFKQKTVQRLGKHEAPSRQAGRLQSMIL